MTEAGFPPYPEEKKEVRDFTVSKKKIYKGKVAPIGKLYLQVSTKTAKGRFSLCQLVTPAQTNMDERIAEMKELLNSKL